MNNFDIDSDSVDFNDIKIKRIPKDKLYKFHSLK